MSPRRVDRRQFVLSGFTIAGGTLLGATVGCSPDEITSVSNPLGLTPREARPADSDLPEPQVIQSVAGRLTASIACVTNPVSIAGRRARQPVTYNDAFPGPTLWVHPGDTIDITFSNRIIFDQADTKPKYGRPPRATRMTNLHFHGMHVSPMGTADNMLVVVPEKERSAISFRFRWIILRVSSGTTLTFMGW